MCSDLNPKRLEVMKQTFRNIHTTPHYKEILNHKAIHAVIISTPTHTHYSLVKESLLAGKDVLCEKPLCLTSKQAFELESLAKKKKRILMVGHVFMYNDGIIALRDMIRSGKCGRLYYMHSERTNLGPFRSDVNAVWDLATHDIAIFNYLLNAMPREVSARGGKYLQSKIEDVAFISLLYPMDVMVNIHVSWLDPKKIRQITVVGDKKMVVWDDLDNLGPLKCYDRKVVPHYYYETFGDFYLLAKEGNITIPKIPLTEPLKNQDAHFLDCIRTRKTPLSDAKNGREVLEVLSAIQKSLVKKGAPVRVA